VAKQKLKGKCLYAAIHREMNDTQLDVAGSNDAFHKQRRRRWNTSDDQVLQAKKSSTNASTWDPKRISAGSDVELLCAPDNPEGV
jgi:hypothetical protein